MKDKVWLVKSGFYSVCIGQMICLVLLAFKGQAQTILYPGLDGEDLLDAVRLDYTPQLSLDYGQARDTLYFHIDRLDDSIHTIYTDYAAFLDEIGDPTVNLFAQDVNTEHIYPQGRGATQGTPPYHNMYNLAAARVDVNQDRANLPFAEIPDHQTDWWYYKADKMMSIPSSGRDAYSEANHSAFEPREEWKGNVARSMFYIHTIYRDQVEDVDPIFFEEQVEDLCAWHFADPVDEIERNRNEAIASYQDGKSNPFILDCTLADRLYCGNMGPCMVGTSTVSTVETNIQLVGTSPFSEKFIVNASERSLDLEYSIYSLQGVQMVRGRLEAIHSKAWIPIHVKLPAGTYIFESVSSDGGYQTQIVQF